MPGYKVILSWDIAPEHEQEYFEFVVREFIPGVQKLGFELTDAWATIYGDQPQIMVGAELPSLKDVQKTLNSNEWISLTNTLQMYVENYNLKVAESHGGFQF
ncbi:MAG TPA: hypothetical protein VIO61_16590 [Anaerolineaceae bacterium]